MALSYDKIPTKASQSISSEEVCRSDPFEVIVHTRKPKKVKTIQTKDTKPKSSAEGEQSFDIKRARHEVIRFGATGLGVKEKKNAQIALAVKLGAKPPKGTHKSLKEYHQERRALALAHEKNSESKFDGGLQAKQITNFHCNQLISTAQRRKRKLKDDQNTIRDYGKVDPTK